VVGVTIGGGVPQPLILRGEDELSSLHPTSTNAIVNKANKKYFFIVNEFLYDCDYHNMGKKN
jgi:hypothetical protein